jgi:hypothetical protein
VDERGCLNAALKILIFWHKTPIGMVGRGHVGTIVAAPLSLLFKCMAVVSQLAMSDTLQDDSGVAPVAVFG